MVESKKALHECETPNELVLAARALGVEFVDLKFTDLFGRWHHLGMPASKLSDETFSAGLGFDGSSIRGWRSVESSDMLLIPEVKSAKLDPFYQRVTLSLTCRVVDPVTGLSYDRDPRGVAIRAEEYLKASGIADVCFIGPEAEFFLFDDVRFEQSTNAAFYMVDSNEGAWNSGRDERPNLGYKPAQKEGYLPTPPFDELREIRQEMCVGLERLGIDVEAEHHEVASGGQCEIDIRYAPLAQSAEHLQWLKYVVKNVARSQGRAATFMPKPLYDDNGSGMHTHISLWKNDMPLFAGDKYAGLSDTALHFIGGILKHGKALVALTNPTTNSFKRLVPGYEAPVNLTYSARNRSAAVRIPMYNSAPSARRVEFRTPDPSANPYLAFSALLMAGLDGIENKIAPGDPICDNMYDLSEEQLATMESVPATLEEALNALEQDHDWLLKGDVFTKDLLDSYIAYKRENEVLANRARPTPFEFIQYFGI